MLVKGFDKQVPIPKGDSAMWEGGRTDLACELALYATKFVLEVLSPYFDYQTLYAFTVREGQTYS